MADFINLTTPPGGASPQNAFDIFKGSWAYDIPVEGTTTGTRPTFRRTPPGVTLMQKHFPNLAEFDVLELGPHEGEHSYHLGKLVRHVYAIEGRTGNFLKCLIAKNELAMNRVRFSLGDFVGYLVSPRSIKIWDLCYACGVIYHMTDPAELMRLLALKSKRVVFTTHIFDWQQMLDADAVTAAEGASTFWCRDTEQTPTRHETAFGVYDYHRRVYFTNDREQALGHGASHSMYANMVSSDTMRKIVTDLGGNILEWQTHINSRGPTADAVIDFSHLHAG